MTSFRSWKNLSFAAAYEVSEGVCRYNTQLWVAINIGRDDAVGFMVNGKNKMRKSFAII